MPKLKSAIATVSAWLIIPAMIVLVIVATQPDPDAPQPAPDAPDGTKPLMKTDVIDPPDCIRYRWDLTREAPTLRVWHAADECEGKCTIENAYPEKEANPDDRRTASPRN